MRKNQPGPRAPATMLLVRAVVLLVAPPILLATACTGDTESPGAPGSSPSTSATGPAPSLRERAAPFEVRYRRVAGDIRESGRAHTLRAVSRPVRAWIDDGFVAGPWPRESFEQAYVPFGRDITARARRDADLLTLHSMGGSLAEVVPQRRRIAVSVTGLRGHVVGATARVDLRVLGIGDGGRRARVNVHGDLYLTRVAGHGWKIFGYRLDRWVEHGAMTAPSTPAGQGAGQGADERAGREAENRGGGG